MAELLHVDLTEGTAERKAMAAGQQNLGGRALTSNVVASEVEPTTDPLGSGNLLVFATGVLAGTAVPNGGRLSVGAKSPLTGTIKEANAGGLAARKLATLGLRAVKVAGKAPVLSVLELSVAGGKLTAAPELAGLRSRATVAELRKRYGDKVAIICIGPAGELQLKSACVLVTTPDFHLRAAARGGLGAVMGSKNLKAVVIDDAGAPGVQVAAPAAVRAAAAALSKGIVSHPAMGALKALGSPMLIDVASELGCLPTKNFSAGVFEGAPQITGSHMVELLANRPGSVAQHSCMPGCVVRCSQVYTDEHGNELTSGIEYETLGLLGSNCLITDLDQLARIDGLCDDLGVDTIEIGAAVGVAMEAGLIPWGDGKAVYELLEKIPIGDERARLLASGCVATGKALGVARVPAVKGQGIAAWEPRVLKGTGVTYATSPMGADHTAGNALPSPTSDYDPSSPHGQVEMSEFLQAYFAGIDSLGFCLFPSLALLDIPELQTTLISAVAAISGSELPEDFLISLGKQTVLTEREFNRRAGFTAADDRLPAFMVTEALPPTGNRFDVSEDDLDRVFAT
jgi:aldehyde:ferredoxin oxidoreductase